MTRSEELFNFVTGAKAQANGTLMSQYTVELIRFVLRETNRTAVTLCELTTGELQEARPYGYLLIRAYRDDGAGLQQIDVFLAVIDGPRRQPSLDVTSLTAETLRAAYAALIGADSVDTICFEVVGPHAIAMLVAAAKTPLRDETDAVARRLL